MLEIYGRLFRLCTVSVEKYQTLSQEYKNLIWSCSIGSSLILLSVAWLEGVGLLKGGVGRGGVGEERMLLSEVSGMNS